MPQPARHRLVAAVALSLSVATVLAACSGSSDDASESTGTPTAGSDAAAKTREVAITLTPASCAAPLPSYPAGPLTFKVTNKDATAVSEFELLSGARILGEKENLPPGFSGSFALRLDAGTYTLYCPGAESDRVPLRVTGSSSATNVSDTSKLLALGTRQYATYVDQQSMQLIESVRPLVAALNGSDLKAAQDAYKRARSSYEHVEPVAESFSLGKQNLDANIDARAGDVPARQWRGFHYIEQGLFARRSLDGLAPYGTELLANVRKLHSLVTGLTYQPAELANGALALLDEVSKSKISGEEERYSHIDLLDFAANVEGSQQAFACLQPGLDKIDAQLAGNVSAAFTDLQDLLDGYRDTGDASGFVLYGTLTADDKTALSHALQAVAEPLSRVAGKVVGG